MEKAIYILNNKGQKLAADVGEVAGSKKLAVLLPGFLDSKDYPHMVSLASDLRNIGFTTMRFDSTGTWKSEGDISEYSLSQRIADVHSVIVFAKEKYGIENILIATHSMGGRVAMLYAEKHPGVNALAIIMGAARSSMALRWPEGQSKVSKRDSPENPEIFIEFKVPYSFVEDTIRYEAMNSLAQLHIPVLFIAGEQDAIVPSSKVQEGYRTANDPKKFIAIHGVGHDYRKNPEEIELVNKEVLQFLKEYSL